MPLYDIYSKRQKRLNEESLDMYKYNNIPGTLKVQTIYIINEIFGINNKNSNKSNIEHIFKYFHDAIAREHGLFDLYPSSNSYYEKIKIFISYYADTEQFLDVIEFIFSFIEDKDDLLKENFSIHSDYPSIESIDELNIRFLEHGLGYRFEKGHILRIDSLFIHSEIVKPVLNLLNNEIYNNSNQEFLKSHEHYREGRYEEAIVEANKAFESVMKVIHSKRGWDLPSPANAKKLITSLMSRGILPASMSNYFNNLNEVLAGLPVLRNSNAGHGAGTEERETPGYLASYALHLAATNIVFLIEAEKAMV